MIEALGYRQSGEKTMLQPFRKVREFDCICRTKEAAFELGKRLVIGLEPSIDVSEFNRRIAPLERALGLDKRASEPKSLRGLFGPI
jgi:hypothetical protein